MNESEWLFQTGIKLMAGGVGVLFLSGLILSISGRRLRKRLEKEFGKPRR